MTTLTEHDDDAVLPRFGYRQQFVRSLRHFESFAVAFSFISITTGIFTTFGFALGTGGPRAIWTWPIVIVGQTLVALVYGALAARVPLSGYSYQWASRLANVHVGWWLGWMSFAFLSIVTVSVDYGLVQVAFQPLIGQAYTPTSAALETLVVLALQAALIIWSTRMTTRVNNTAVATELAGAGLPLAGRGAAGAGPPAMPYIGEAGTRPYQDAGRIAADPEYGRIVCHCERVTRGEIRDALASTVPPADAGGLRRRTRAMNGRCQGFYCAATVSAMIAAARDPASGGPAGGPGPAGPAAGRASPELGRLA